MMSELQCYAYNLHGGDDTRSAAKLYQSFLGGSLSTSSEPHSELLLTNGLRIIFSRPSEQCPVTPGTLTLIVDDLKISLPATFQKEVTLPSTMNYCSYLDIWGNRLWLYQGINKPS